MTPRCIPPSAFTARSKGELLRRSRYEHRRHNTPNDKGNPAGKLADAELHFKDGELDGLKLIGLAIWERRGGNGRNVTFPARQYQVNGERRSFAFAIPFASYVNVTLAPVLPTS
jgi:hypothetical protein